MIGPFQRNFLTSSFLFNPFQATLWHCRGLMPKMQWVQTPFTPCLLSYCAPNKWILQTMFVAQVVERSLPTPESPVVRIQSMAMLFTINCIMSCIEKTKIKEPNKKQEQTQEIPRVFGLWPQTNKRMLVPRHFV